MGSSGMGYRIFMFFNILIMVFVVVIMLYPLLHVLALSLSSNEPILLGQVSFFPRGLQWFGYKTILTDPQFWLAYRNTIMYVAIGVPINLLLTSLISYPLAMKEFMFRKSLTVFLVITLFFNGGLIPTFLVVKSLGLLNTPWAIVLPTAVSAFNVVVYRTFFQNIPIELRESAFVDGANDLVILFRIYLPLSMPLLATFGLFAIVGIWNDWFDPLIYLNNTNLQPIALYLQQVVDQGNVNLLSGALTGSDFLTKNPVMLEMAAIVLTMLPVLFVYPFVQRFFTKGLLIGAVKS